MPPYGVGMRPGLKRKERDDAGVGDRDAPRLPPTAKAELTRQPVADGSRLLAGYLAHEFLTRGTLLGQRYGPPHPVSESSSSSPAPSAERAAAYGVAALLKGDHGAHVPGVVNPTQLARWLQM